MKISKLLLLGCGAGMLIPMVSCGNLGLTKSKGDVVVSAPAFPYDSTANITRDNLASLPGQKVIVLPKIYSGKGGETGVTLFTKRPGAEGYANATVVSPDKSMAVYKSKAGAFDNEVFDIVGVDSVQRVGKEETTKFFYLVVRNDKYPANHWMELGETYDLFADGKLDERGELVVTDLLVDGYLQKLRGEMKGRKLVNKSTDNRSEFTLDYVVRKVGDGVPLESLPKDHVWEVTDVAVVNTPNYAGLSYLLTSKSIKDVCSRANEINFIPYEDFMADAKSDKARMTALIKKYGRANAKLISDGKVKVGFTKKMCEEALGNPVEIVKTTVKKRVIEKWIYGPGTALNFRSGKLVSIDAE